MKNETYNGWTNYATWRINLEIFDGAQFECAQSSETLKDYVDEVLFSNDESETLVESYARAFISDVNYHEIANHINEELVNA